MPLIQRTWRPRRAMLAALAVSAPLAGVSLACPQSADNLAQLLDQAEAELAGGGNTVVWRNEAQSWLDRLRLAVASDPQAPQVPAAMLQIGEILDRMGAREAALSEYLRIGPTPADFGWHLEGLLRCVRIASALDDEPHRALAFLDEFEQGVFVAAGQRRELWEQHRRSFEGCQVIRANIFAAAAQRVGTRTQSPADSQIAALYLLRAGELLDDWIAARGRLEDPAAVAAERIRGASYFIEAGTLLARSGDSGGSGGAHAAASQLLEYAMTDPWSEGRQHYAAALQLKNLFAIHGASDMYLGEARRVLGVAVPGHEALSYLRELADTVSGSPTTLRLADDLFQLVADTEMRWFPDEYRRHVNYQWSRVEQGMIALAFGDVDRASRIAEEIEALPMEGDYFSGRRDHIRKSVDRRGAPRLPTQVSSEVAVEVGARGISPENRGRASEPVPIHERDMVEGEPSVQSEAAPRAKPPALHAVEDGAEQSDRSEREAPVWSTRWIALGLCSMAVGILLFVRVRKAVG